jgi:hypothetical protein
MYAYEIMHNMIIESECGDPQQGMIIHIITRVLLPQLITSCVQSLLIFSPRTRRFVTKLSSTRFKMIWQSTHVRSKESQPKCSSFFFKIVGINVLLF